MVLAHVLAPARLGVYAFVLSFATVLTVPAMFGAPTLALREVAAAKARGDYGLMKGLLTRLHQFVALSSLAIAAIAAVFALLTPWGRSDPATVLWGVALIPLIPLSALRGGVLRGWGAVAQGQWPDLVLKPAVFLAGLGAVFLARRPLGPDEAMAMTALSSLAALAVGWWLYRRLRPAQLVLATPVYRSRAWLAALVPMGVTGGALLINGQIGVLLAGLDGAETAGLYRPAIQTSLIAGLGYTAVIAALAPRFAAAHAKGDREGLARTAAAGAALAVVTCLPFVALFAVAGGPLMRLVFGAPYAVAGPALAVMTLAQLCNATFGAASSALIMAGHERRAAVAFVAALAVHAGLGVVLIPRFGVDGAAWAYLGQMAVMNLVLWWQARTLLGLDTGVWAAWRLLRR
ncbi:MAG: polysaccharide biosynthesis protein [Caulobacter sp.]|nr:polysaccharide biosynthesis protein [Caulobacter sp.]